jgi:RNA polymerase sigma factor (sigma-70 family)
MEVSALKYSGGITLHGRSPLLRLQSDERLIAYLRRGNMAAFEVLLSRYESRLLAFCRHLLGSREDAEDVMQEVMTAAFNAILADDRPINVRPWLYRIARNRSLNHLRRIQAIGVDSMDMHFSEHGASTADKVHEREEFRLLVGDIHELPETQKTALVLREMDALSYDQIAEAMETTVPSVKSLLVRARVSLAEAAEARLLSCDEVRIELGEIAEGLRRRPSPLVRRHLKACERCTVFRGQLKETNKALAALMPIGPLVILKKLALAHLGHSAGAGSGATAAGAGSGAAAGGAGAAGAGAGGAAFAGSGVAASSTGFISAGLGAIATKAAAGLAAAALVTAGAVEADHSATRVHHHRTAVASVQHASSPAQQAVLTPIDSQPERRSSQQTKHSTALSGTASAKPDSTKATSTPKTTKTTKADATDKNVTGQKTAGTAAAAATTSTAPAPTSTTVQASSTAPPAGREQTQQDPTVMAPTGALPGDISPTTTQPTTDPTTTASPTAQTTDDVPAAEPTGTDPTTGQTPPSDPPPTTAPPVTTPPTGSTPPPTGTTPPIGTTPPPTDTTPPTGTTPPPTGDPQPPVDTPPSTPTSTRPSGPGASDRDAQVAGVG